MSDYENIKDVKKEVKKQECKKLERSLNHFFKAQNNKIKIKIKGELKK
jgi:hypothetical protein